MQRPGARSAVRCTQSTDNGRRSAEQCGIQATSQCRDQRNNERSHCGLQADARPRRAAAAESRSSHPTSRPKLNRRGSPIVRRLGNKLTLSAKYVEINSKKETAEKREEIKFASIIPIPVSAESIFAAADAFDARNLFSTTLNEALCQHEDNPQDSLTMLPLWTSSPPFPSLLRPLLCGHVTRTPTVRRVATLSSPRQFCSQFCSTPSSSGRQSPISRSTEIQFKPLITTELGSLPPFPPPPLLPLSSYHFLQPPYHNRSYLPPATPFASPGSPVSRLPSRRERTEWQCIFPI